MTRIRCRHCKAPVDLGDDEDGFSCPKCSRYTPRHEPAKATLPPPTSDHPGVRKRERKGRPVSLERRLIGCFAMLGLIFLLLFGVGFVLRVITARDNAEYERERERGKRLHEEQMEQRRQEHEDFLRKVGGAPGRR